jgi:hypothetical protein
MVAHTGFLTVARRVVPEQGLTPPPLATDASPEDMPESPHESTGDR